VWTAILGIFAAVTGLVGVAVGAMVTGYVTLRQAQLVTQREREARQVLREQEQKDRRDAFQRDTILALQDAMGDLYKATGREQDRLLGEAAARGGAWRAKPIEEPLPEDFLEAHRAISKLRARIFDEELRAVSASIRDEASKGIIAFDRQIMMLHLGRMQEHAERFNARVMVILPDLF
jgi:hypothetical protein